MTVIAALVHNGEAWLGADSQQTMAGNAYSVNKVRATSNEKQTVLWGVSGYGSHVHLLSKILERRMLLQNRTLFTTLDEMVALGAEWAEMATTHDLLNHSTDYRDGIMASNAILATRGAAWIVLHNEALPVQDFAAIGAGEDFVLGALEVLYPDVLKGVHEPQDALSRAITGACARSIYCGGDVVVQQA